MESGSWHVRLSDGATYGPIDTNTLQEWVIQGRVSADDSLSQDLTDWSSASEIDALGFDWLVRLPNGSEFGPVNIQSISPLVLEGTISRLSKIRNIKTNESTTVGLKLKEMQ